MRCLRRRLMYGINVGMGGGSSRLWRRIVKMLSSLTSEVVGGKS